MFQFLSISFKINQLQLRSVEIYLILIMYLYLLDSSYLSLHLISSVIKIGEGKRKQTEFFFQGGLYGHNMIGF